MDAVYAVRPGERNESLRYSLRSLVNVEHDGVWLFGHAPSWVSNVGIVKRGRVGSKYETVTQHIKAACMHNEVSDPFMLWNDDFFALEHIGPMPRLHRGPLAPELKQFSRRRDEWARSLRGVEKVLSRSAVTMLSYELHVPLIVHKAEMLDAIARLYAAGVPSACRRTVYGNLTDLGGVEIPDPKMKKDWLPGPWISTHPGSFNLRAKPHLQRLFPHSGPYEVPSESVFSPAPVLGPTKNLRDPQNGVQIDETHRQREETE